MAERTVDNGVRSDDKRFFVAVIRVIPTGQTEIGRHYDHSVLFLLFGVRFFCFLSLSRLVCAYHQNALHEFVLLIEDFAEILSHLPPVLRIPIDLQKILADCGDVGRGSMILTVVSFLQKRIQRVQQVFSELLRMKLPSKSHD